MNQGSPNGAHAPARVQQSRTDQGVIDGPIARDEVARCTRQGRGPIRRARQGSPRAPHDGGRRRAGGADGAPGRATGGPRGLSRRRGPEGRPRPEDPYEVVRSPRLAEVIGEARQRYDSVVVDTPPLVPVSDNRVLARCVDAFLVVVAAHSTPRRLVEEGLRLVDPAKLLGIVFNQDARMSSEYRGYYGRTRDEARAESAQRPARRKAVAAWR